MRAYNSCNGDKSGLSAVGYATPCNCRTTRSEQKESKAINQMLRLTAGANACRHRGQHPPRARPASAARCGNGAKCWRGSTRYVCNTVSTERAMPQRCSPKQRRLNPGAGAIATRSVQPPLVPAQSSGWPLRHLQTFCAANGDETLRVAIAPAPPFRRHRWRLNSVVGAMAQVTALGV